MPPLKRSAGWRSTKLHLALITMVLVTVVYGIAGFEPQYFGEYCMGLLGAAGIYSVSNTAQKFSRQSKAVNPDEE